MIEIAKTYCHNKFPNVIMPVKNLIFTNRVVSQKLRAELSKITGYKLVDTLLMPLEYHSQ